MATDVERRGEAMGRIFRLLDRSRLGWRLVEVAGGLIRTFLLTGGALVAGLLADNLFHLPGPFRVAYAIGLLALLLTMLARFVAYPLLRPLTDEMVAAHVERNLPDLDNRVINAVLLAGERFHDPLTRRLADSQIDETGRSVAGPKLKGAAGARALWTVGRWALGLTAVGALYALAFSAHFANAFTRLVHPAEFIPPITDTRLDVSPGNADLLQGDPLTVEARVGGVLPQGAQILVRPAGCDGARDEMVFEGNAFIYRFANVQRDFTYQVRAGDAATRRYQVRVHDRPSIERMDLVYRYPPYTGMGDLVEEGAPGDIRAPVGTRVKVRAYLDRQVSEGSIELRPEDGEAARLPFVEEAPQVRTGQIDVERPGTYALHVAERVGEGASIPNSPRVYRIDAVADASPRVFFEQPGRDVAVAPDAQVTLIAGAEDDFSLRNMTLFVQRRAGADWEPIQTWDYEGGTRTARDGCVLSVADMDLRVGDSLAYYMRASDGLRRGDGADNGDADAGNGRSRTYQIRVVDPALAGRDDAGSARAALRDIVRKLIEMQSANLRQTLALEEWAGREEALVSADAPAWDDYGGRGTVLVRDEEAVYKLATDTVLTYTGEDASRMTEALGRIAAGQIGRAVDQLRDLSAARDRDALPALAAAAAQTERRIVEMLQKLLDDPAALLAEILREEGRTEKLSEKEEELTSGEQLAEKLLKSLEDFADEQRRAIEMSKRLAERAVDDFTDEDEGDLERIIETEKEWSKFFQEAATDLSKLPPQDKSLGNQAKEFLEVFSEVQQAIEEAERQAVELAVPHEQSGLELAESIETNLEKWLMETKDNQLWSMEDPLEDIETPITDLPDELQDLIGDLVESEEDMEEQFDDVTSGWMDSLDIGAGWDTMDGPISNMSAKGVTGNRLPNTSEIGGRSGEGRTGKSSGQFVEEEATGKGGRQTPSRLTPDPFEAGWVKDSSSEAPTGATGGGKVSGQGAEGFQGPMPPPLQQSLKRLAQQQSEIIDKARRLDYGLKHYRQPRGRLPEAIEMMEIQRDALEGGEVGNFARQQRIVLSNLREVKELSDKQKQLWRDRSALLPKELREEIAASRSEQVPEQYREMVDNYFRALSEAATRGE
jgi:hypothetical protein